MSSLFMTAYLKCRRLVNQPSVLDISVDANKETLHTTSLQKF
jgi:hypothetical protein